jgi:hypothetical protein
MNGIIKIKETKKEKGIYMISKQKTLLAVILTALSFNALAVESALMQRLTLTKTTYDIDLDLSPVEKKETLLSVQKENFNPGQFTVDPNHILENKDVKGVAFYISYKGISEGKANFSLTAVNRDVKIYTAIVQKMSPSSPDIKDIVTTSNFSVEQEKGQLHRTKTVNVGELLNDNDLTNYQLTVENF